VWGIEGGGVRESGAAPRLLRNPRNTFDDERGRKCLREVRGRTETRNPGGETVDVSRARAVVLIDFCLPPFFPIRPALPPPPHDPAQPLARRPHKRIPRGRYFRSTASFARPALSYRRLGAIAPSAGANSGASYAPAPPDPPATFRASSDSKEEYSLGVRRRRLT
jgi:hypothetical protein